VFGGLVPFIGTTPSRAPTLSVPASGTKGFSFAERFSFELGEPAADKTSPPTTFRVPESSENIATLRKTAHKQASGIDVLTLLQRVSAGTPCPSSKGD
jgi:hypothetical protein